MASLFKGGDVQVDCDIHVVVPAILSQLVERINQVFHVAAALNLRMKLLLLYTKRYMVTGININS